MTISLRGIVFISGFLWLTFPALLTADSSALLPSEATGIESLFESEENKEKKESNVAHISFRMFSSLLFVLALICLGVWFFKRFWASPLLGASIGYVIGRIAIGGRKTICVVKIAEKALVLGISETGITPITELKASDFPEPEKKSFPSEGKFAEILSGKMKTIFKKS